MYIGLVDVISGLIFVRLVNRICCIGIIIMYFVYVLIIMLNLFLFFYIENS